MLMSYQIPNMLIIKDFKVWFLFLCLLTQGAIAQNQAGNHWYFGSSNRGIVFNRPNYEVDLFTGKLPLGQGGSAVATDPVTGNILFYTDGTQIIDASHTVMSNGNGLTGNSSLNQGIAIVQNPSITTEYYVFYLTATGELRVSVVEMNLNGNSTSPRPLGEVTSKNQLVPGVPGNLSESILILPDPNGTDFWMILHSNNSNAYHFVKIDVGGPTFVSTQTVGSITNVANLSYHAGSEKIGVAPKALNQNVETLSITFDPASLVAPTLVSTSVLNSAVTAGAGPDFVYDTEFSSNGRFLYVSYASGDVVQFDLENNTPPSPIPQSILPTPRPDASYGLQMGPDSVIYHLYQVGANFFLGAIDSTNNVADSILYTPQILAGNFNAKQFPTFAVSHPTDITTLSFLENGLCANSPTSFYPTVLPSADSLVWDFGDGTTLNTWSPVHTYESGGTYNVTVTAYLNGETQQSSRSINITNFDLQITLPQDTIACSCELPFPKVSNPATPPAANPCNPFTITAQLSASAQWSWYGPSGFISSGTGSNAVLQPDSAGYYYLVATNGTCSTHAGINIKEYGLQDQRANIWYFGNHAGIDFNTIFDTPSQGPLAITNSVMQAPEGTSTISDQNGQVIFFTDGVHVWTKNGDVYTELAVTPLTPDGIGGNLGSTQAALIVPVVDDETLFYIFTTQEIYGSNTYSLRYSLFDLKLNNGAGGLVQQNVELFSPSTERIASNGGYLLAHEYGNNTFRAYPITINGIGAPVISTAGSVHSFSDPVNGAGYMKFGDGGKVAVALSTPGVRNVIEVFDFSNGIVSNVQQIDLNNTTAQVYGIEFADRKIFATVGNRVYEYWHGNDGNYYTVDTPPYIQVTENLGAMQRGPDGQIYIAADGQNYLKQINVRTDSAASTMNQDFNLAGGSSSTLGLPSFVQSLGDPPQTPALSISGICFGDTTAFRVSGLESIDTVTWSLGDGAGAKGVRLDSMNHIYTSPGEYEVIVRVTNRCIGLVKEFREKIIIRPKPADPTQSIALCDDPLVLDANISNAVDRSYLWSTGETTRTITVTAPGSYHVTVTDIPSGCSTPGRILVIRPITDFSIGADAQLCVGEPNRELNTGININQHTWFVNGTEQLGITGPRLTTDFSTPGTKIYRVAFFDTFSGCTLRDTVTFVVNPTPTATLTTISNVTCGSNNGALAVGITAPAGRNMVYTLLDPTGGNVASQSVTTVPFTTNHTGLTNGSYSLNVTDVLSGCALNTAATISVTDFTVDDFTQTICEPINIPITTTIDLSTPVQYIIRNTANNTTFSGTLTTNGQLSEDFFGPGVYLIEVMADGGCVSAGTATLTQLPPITGIDFNLDNFCSDRQISVLPTGYNYSWAPTNAIVSGADTRTVTLTDAPGVYTLTATLEDGSGTFCKTSQDITIAVDNFTPAFVPQVCDAPYTLTATPTNNASPLLSYVYAWTFGGNPFGAGQEITILSGGSYVLTMANLTTGCSRSTPSSTVTIPIPFTVAIQPLDVPCDGGEPFRLEAITTPSIPGLTYSWELNDVSVGTNNSTLSGQLQAGTYKVTASDGNCPRTNTIDIFLLPATKGNLPREAFICPEPENPKPETRQVILDPGAGFTSYAWFEVIGGGASPLNITEQTFTVDRVGTFRVLLENAFGCFSRNDTEVLVDCEPVITAPNAFRPTSSLSSNQQFKLITLFIDQDDFQIYIFNRWGELVFESNQLDFGWNGGYNNNGNQILPAGTYSYVVRYKSKYRPEEGLQEKRGGLVLVR
jgi:gliding motility-associated-like protein